MFELEYAEEWDSHYSKLDKSGQLRIQKKIKQLLGEVKARHLKFGLDFFVLETGQYRICFKEMGTIRRLHFAGNHKQYEKWYKEQEF